VATVKSELPDFQLLWYPAPIVIEQFHFPHLQLRQPMQAAQVPFQVALRRPIGLKTKKRAADS
jgi:hypothetical protein